MSTQEIVEREKKIMEIENQLNKIYHNLKKEDLKNLKHGETPEENKQQIYIQDKDQYNIMIHESVDGGNAILTVDEGTVFSKGIIDSLAKINKRIKELKQ